MDPLSFAKSLFYKSSPFHVLVLASLRFHANAYYVYSFVRSLTRSQSYQMQIVKTGGSVHFPLCAIHSTILITMKFECLNCRPTVDLSHTHPYTPIYTHIPIHRPMAQSLKRTCDKVLEWPIPIINALSSLQWHSGCVMTIQWHTDSWLVFIIFQAKINETWKKSMKFQIHFDHIQCIIISVVIIITIQCWTTRKRQST